MPIPLGVDLAGGGGDRIFLVCSQKKFVAVKGGLQCGAHGGREISQLWE